MRDIVDLALWAGQLQLQYGTDTERAESTIHHLGTGLGCDWLDASISSDAIIITTISDKEFRTRVRRLVRFGGVNMNIVAAVNDLRNENLITRPFVVTASAVFWRAKALTTNLNGEVI